MTHQHAVSLVEHKISDGFDAEAAVLDQVVEPTRRGDDDLCMRAIH